MDQGFATSPVTTEVVDDLSLFCHDLQQLVGAGLLLSRHPGDELLAEALGERFRALDEILRQMSTMIGVATDREPHELQILDLARLVDECARVVRLNRSARIVVDSEDGVRAHGVAALLRRALVNLLDNGARAAGDDGVVNVRVWSRDDVSVVEVADDGRGWGQIPQVSGRGLTSVAMALHRCHGHLEVPRRSGCGATVRVVLPTHDGLEFR